LSLLTKLVKAATPSVATLLEQAVPMMSTATWEAMRTGVSPADFAASLAALPDFLHSGGLEQALPNVRAKLLERAKPVATSPDELSIYTKWLDKVLSLIAAKAAKTREE
jgi:predicted NAD-dependent protein-ADP-ribosyltransferase YbiA (DUF1768 family)